MSQTPRTDRWIKNINGRHYVQIERCRELEQKLNAANDRIKRLEQLGDALAYAIEESCDPTFANDVTRWRKNREAME